MLYMFYTCTYTNVYTYVKLREILLFLYAPLSLASDLTGKQTNGINIMYIFQMYVFQ